MQILELNFFLVLVGEALEHGIIIPMRFSDSNLNVYHSVSSVNTNAFYNHRYF